MAVFVSVPLGGREVDEDFPAGAALPPTLAGNRGGRARSFGKTRVVDAASDFRREIVPVGSDARHDATIVPAPTRVAGPTGAQTRDGGGRASLP